MNQMTYLSIQRMNRLSFVGASLARDGFNALPIREQGSLLQVARMKASYNACQNYSNEVYN